jgi:urease accessory protein
MLKLTRVHEEPVDPAARVHILRLAYAQRVRSRLAALCEDGTAAAITLPRGTAMRDGVLLATDDGRLARVQAAREPLARITAGSPVLLLRAVYHLANRHVPVQIAEDHALIERDPVLERMLDALGVRIAHVEAPFDPEGGAYPGHAHHGPAFRDESGDDTASAGIGEQLSIEAHRARACR